MPDAETAPGALAKSGPRIGRKVWWLGLGTSVLTAAALSMNAYAVGLPPIFEEIDNLDKALHFSLAGVLAFFLDGVLQRHMIRVAAIALPLSAVLLLVPAGIEEFLQRYSVNRSSSFGDFFADVAGVAVFIWLSRRLDR